MAKAPTIRTIPTANRTRMSQIRMDLKFSCLASILLTMASSMTGSVDVVGGLWVELTVLVGVPFGFNEACVGVGRAGYTCGGNPSVGVVKRRVLVTVTSRFVGGWYPRGPGCPPVGGGCSAGPPRSGGLSGGGSGRPCGPGAAWIDAAFGFSVVELDAKLLAPGLGFATPVLPSPGSTPPAGFPASRRWPGSPRSPGVLLPPRPPQRRPGSSSDPFPAGSWPWPWDPDCPCGPGNPPCPGGPWVPGCPCGPRTPDGPWFGLSWVPVGG